MKGRATPGAKPYYHLVLLARDMAGYKNLVKLSSLAYTEGFYSKPRVDRELLAQVQRGADRQLGLPRRRDRARSSRRATPTGAREAASWYADVFKDRYYLEVQAHDSEGQAKHNAQIFQLGDRAEPAGHRDERRALPQRDRTTTRTTCCSASASGRTAPTRTGCTTTGASTSRARPRCASGFRDRPDVLENTLRIADEAGFAFEKKYYVPVVPAAARGGDARTSCS